MRCNIPDSFYRLAMRETSVSKGPKLALQRRMFCTVISMFGTLLGAVALVASWSSSHVCLQGGRSG